MPLHPELEAFLELARDAASTRPPLHALSAIQARAAYDDSTEALDCPGADVPVEMHAVPTRDGANIAARLYRGASGQQRSAALLFMHGGGYVLGGLQSHDSLCRDIASQAQCAVLAVDYRKAPEYRFPTAFEDTQDAWEWLGRHAEGLGLDPGRLAVGGDSVGGSMAAALCIAAREAGQVQPLLQLLLYPCTAARQDSASHARYAKGYLLEGDTLAWMFAQYLRGDEDRDDWRFAALAARSLAGLAPAHIVLAEYDPLVDEGRDYHARLLADGGKSELRVHAGMVHDFGRLGNITGEADAMRRAIGATLAEVFLQEAVGETPGEGVAR